MVQPQTIVLSLNFITSISSCMSYDKVFRVWSFKKSINLVLVGGILFCRFVPIGVKKSGCRLWNFLTSQTLKWWLVVALLYTTNKHTKDSIMCHSTGFLQAKHLLGLDIEKNEWQLSTKVIGSGRNWFHKEYQENKNIYKN